MKDLNTKQLKAMEQAAQNAAPVVLGTLVLGGTIAPQKFSLLFFGIGITIYLWILWLLVKFNERRNS